VPNYKHNTISSRKTKHSQNQRGRSVLHHCVVIFSGPQGSWSVHYCCLHLKMEFRSCARGRQWCGKGQLARFIRLHCVCRFCQISMKYTEKANHFIWTLICFLRVFPFLSWIKFWLTLFPRITNCNMSLTMFAADLLNYANLPILSDFFDLALTFPRLCSIVFAFYKSLYTPVIQDMFIERCFYWVTVWKSGSVVKILGCESRNHRFESGLNSIFTCLLTPQTLNTVGFPNVLL